MGSIILNHILLSLITKYACISLIRLTFIIIVLTTFVIIVVPLPCSISLIILCYCPQMKQIRTALAIASLLKRTLVRMIQTFALVDHNIL